ncbi:MAG: hypothetical protein AAF206_08190, partial [Bacteroidota bacterium]
REVERRKNSVHFPKKLTDLILDLLTPHLRFKKRTCYIHGVKRIILVHSFGACSSLITGTLL